MSDILLTVDGSNEIAIEVVNGDVVSMSVSDIQPIDLEISAVTGLPGPTGPGVAAGGEIGQKLQKKTAGDYDTEWVTDNVPAGVDKEVQFNDGGVIGGESNFKYDKNTKSLILGIPESLPDNPLAIGRAINSWLQANIQNTTEGDNASCDWVATANNGDDSSNYADVGINSSVYDSDSYPFYAPNDAYLQAESPRIIINAIRDGSSIELLTGGSSSENLRASINESGIVVAPGHTIKIGLSEQPIPEIYYGTGSPPSAAGKPDGALFFKYTP